MSTADRLDGFSRWLAIGFLVLGLVAIAFALVAKIASFLRVPG